MATVEECEAALHGLAALIADNGHEPRAWSIPARSLVCEVSDLDAKFSGRLGSDGLTDIMRGHLDGAQIRLKVRSDDLIALTRGELNFAHAWATGRIKVDASITDLLRLRSLL